MGNYPMLVVKCVFLIVEDYIQDKEMNRNIFYLIHVGLSRTKTDKIKYTTQVQRLIK